MKLVAVVSCLLLAACVPWTVRPINDAASGPFSAARYVEGIWATKVLPAVNGAPDLATARRAAARSLVKGEGRVVRVDTSSLSRLMFVDLAPGDGRADVAVQIGPVIRGNALRDSLPFIEFSQFANQMEYARVGGALNDRAAKNAFASLPADLTGAHVAFAGAMAPAAADQLPEVVPVTLSVQGAAH